MPDQQLENDIASAKEFEAQLKAICEKFHIQVSAILDFPIYKQLPDEVKLALAVIERHGGTYRVLYKLKKE